MKIQSLIMTLGLFIGAACGGTENEIETFEELETAQSVSAVTPAEYCSTLAFIIEHNWDRATGRERAAMSAAWGTHCRAMP